MKHECRVGRYKVELETGIDTSKGDAGSQCWVEAEVGGRTYYASLEALLNEGELRCPSSGLEEDYIHKVRPATIEVIEAWAIDHGY